METTLRFQSFDGITLEGTCTSGAERGDVIAILIHGITSSRDEFGLFSGLSKHLAGRGMPSFRFDYRCHGASTLPMEAMTLSGIVNDIEAAAAAALAQAHASSVYVVGMSFGGGLSAYWAAKTLVPVKSVVMLAPVIDYEEDVLGQHGAIVDGKLCKSMADELQRQGYVETDGIRYGGALVNELRFISGAEGLQQLKCDALIVHGDADSIVPYSSSERFARMHEHCTLINIPGTDHGFGVGDDDDLTSPATREKHREVWGIISRFIEEADRG